MFRWSESLRVLRLAVNPDEQINILQTELRTNAFVYLPGESKLFNVKAGKRDRTMSSR